MSCQFSINYPRPKDELIEKLYDFLGRPAVDPHGDPIPTIQGQFNHVKTLKLSDILKEEIVTMCGVMDHSPAFLQYLNKIGVYLGSKIQVKEITEFDKSMSISVDKSTSIFVSNEVARNILVLA